MFMNKYLSHIEIPKNSIVKYEYDHTLDKMIVDRFLNTSLSYPFNYGYFPKTLSGDGDPLDMILISDHILQSNVYINVKIVGALLTEDEKGKDEKIICVPHEDVDINSLNINNLNDINENILLKIKFFFENYKKLEKNKFTKVNNFINKEEAICLYNDSNKLYKLKTKI